MKRDMLLIIAGGSGIMSSYMIYIATPAISGSGDLYKILYLHVPAAWVAYLSFFISFISSMFYLHRRQRTYDIMAEAAATIGLVYSAVAIISGAIWAEAAWGSYWNWDPRETTTLILWIAYLGFLSLRYSISGRDQRSSVSAVYNILAFLTIPLSYLSITLVPTLHPQIVTAAGISLTAPLIITLALSLSAATLLYGYLLVTAVTLGMAEERLELLRWNTTEKVPAYE